VMSFAFSIFGAAVFAEPAVAKIEEVVGLMHLEGGSHASVVFRHRRPSSCHAGCRQRGNSAASLNLTGTVKRLPSRQI
jgi:hypothetical protein